MSGLFCFGLGYSAGFLARALAGQGWRIAGTARDELAHRDFALRRFDRAHPLADLDAALAGMTHLLLSIPPDQAGDPVLDCHGTALAARKDLRWVGYLSSTAVYGDRGGAWVDEEAALAPAGERGRRRAAAEAGWLALQREHGLPVQIFRLAGIYGPERSALDALRQGRAQRIEKPGTVFSRIHIEDLVQVLAASMLQPRPGRIYNVCDDEPAPPGEVVEFAAALIGRPPPPKLSFADATLSPMARSFYDDNKRVANRRIKDELGVKLLYPSYRQGLAALNRTA